MVGDKFFCLGLHTSFVCVDEDFVGEAAGLNLGFGVVTTSGKVSCVATSFPFLVTEGYPPQNLRYKHQRILAKAR